MNRAVFLDRDGVVNRAIVRDGKAFPPSTLLEFELLPGVADSIASLRNAGFLIVIVTNQPDVATGKQLREGVEAMHQILWSAGLCDAIKVCYHRDLDHCLCRKPKPGMLVEAAGELGISLEESYMVGDRWRDVEAGKTAGCYTFLVDYGYAEPITVQPDAVVKSLAEAAKLILSK